MVKLRWSNRPLGAEHGGLDDKESTCNVGDPGSIPGLGRSPGEGNGYPLRYSCLENPMDKGTWWATVPLITKSQMGLNSKHFHTFNRQLDMRWSRKFKPRVLFGLFRASNMLKSPRMVVREKMEKVEYMPSDDNFSKKVHQGGQRIRTTKDSGFSYWLISSSKQLEILKEEKKMWHWSVEGRKNDTYPTSRPCGM